MHILLQKAAAGGFLLLLTLWLVGLVRTSAVPATAAPASTSSVLVAREDVTSRLQANNLQAIGLERVPLPALLDQADISRIRVHEKAAWLAAQTAAFDEDEKQIRTAVTGQKATVFNEWASGLDGKRQLTLVIGVHPDLFDPLVDELRQVGNLESVRVQQRDRTGEFRQLHAQRQSLRQHLEAVQKLRRAKNPSIEDELRVEQKIQEIEKELQKLSVRLGDLLGKESFYHVHLTLSEYQPASALDRADRVPRYLLRALLWALPWWLAVAAVLGTVPGVYFSVRALRKRNELVGETG